MRIRTVKLTLDKHVKQDPRILKVYFEARRRYSEAGREHHNFTHVMRDLYRSLVIAREESSVDYGILIPAVLLHDIGFCTQKHIKVGHDVAGAELAMQILPPLGYASPTIQAISHCIRAHKGLAELPQSLEAKILYDADVLEKAGLVFLFFAGRITVEFKETVEHFLKRDISHREKEISRGFYTQKAREMDGGRLAILRSMLQRIQKEIKEERIDYSVTEKDLWLEPPESHSTSIP